MTNEMIVRHSPGGNRVSIQACRSWTVENNEQIHDLQPRPPKNPSAPASDWKRRGKIYAVSWDGKEYFPAYQFSEALQPLPVMAEVLAQFGKVADTWQIAAWFHFPNGWLAAAGPGEAPRDCLNERAALFPAIRHRLGRYQA